MPTQMPTVRWTSNPEARAAIVPDIVPPAPSLGTVLGRGLLGRCPSCGNGKIFAGYLKVVTECSACHARLSAARADDLPPYLTILVVGHIVVPLMLWSERAQSPSVMTMSLIFLPMTTILALALLRPIKGATVGLMMRLGLMKPEAEMG